MTEMQDATPPAYQASGPSGPRASFGRRFVAALIDAILLGVVDGILVAVIGRGGGYGIGTLLSLSYFTYFEGSNAGQSVGKRVMGIRVIDFSSGGSIGYPRAAVRWVGRILSGIVCVLGYLWMLWDKEKQTWHDKIANTVVVPVEYYPVTSWP